MRGESTAVLLVLGALSLQPQQVWAADHADTPNLVAVARHDGRITDLHAFKVGGDLVLALSTNPNIAVGATSYTFPSDTTFSFYIDEKARVDFDDASANATYGGTIERPERIRADVTINVTFPNGSPVVDVDGACIHPSQMQVFAGLRDDPFIRAPRSGRNVASIVIQFPLSAVTSKHRPTILVWAGSNVPNINGPIEDLAGRSLRSMFGENDAMNNLPPAMHYTLLGLVPDVVIYDTSRPAAYPNGRALEDDVVDLVGDARVLGNDAPFPSTNDKPFLAAFPYLSEPW